MLQCPLCNNLVTVSHCHTGDHSHDKSADVNQYPGYFNGDSADACGHRGTRNDHARVSLLTRAQQAKHEEINLQIRVLQNQLQQKLIEQELSLMPHVSDTLKSRQDTWSRLEVSKSQMEQCGWFYGPMTNQQSIYLLQNTEDGTFLVRNSQDPQFLYSLSLQRVKEGPTSVRIAFVRGKFSFDAEERIKDQMPEFDSVGELISHYVVGKKSIDYYHKQNPFDPNVSSQTLVLRKPLYKSPPSLAHCARLVINRSLKNSQRFSKHSNSEQVQIPTKLRDYLDRYSLTL